MFSVEHHVLVDVVAHDDEIVLDGAFRDRFELGSVKHLAGWVVGSVQQDQTGLVAQRRVECLDVEAPIGSVEQHRSFDRASEPDGRRVTVVGGLEGDHLVATIAER